MDQTALHTILVGLGPAGPRRARTEHKRNLALGPEPSSASALAVTTDTAVVDGDPGAQAALPSMIALLRYRAGIPHFRLEGLQASL